MHLYWHTINNDYLLRSEHSEKLKQIKKATYEINIISSKYSSFIIETHISSIFKVPTLCSNRLHSFICLIIITFLNILNLKS